MTPRPLSAVTVLYAVMFTLTATAADQPLPKSIKTSKPVTYQVTMTTTFVVPEGNDKIDQVKVYHALPTVRPWSEPKAKFGATGLKFTPEGAKEEHHEPTDSDYLLWTVDGVQKPGTKLTFTSEMTITSPARRFDPKAAKVSWKDYDGKPEDKTAVVAPADAKAVHPELAKMAAKFKAEYAPPEAVLAMCKWILDTFKYDASVTFPITDFDSILEKKCGHCGHRAMLFQQLTASAGIPLRTVCGMYFQTPDGHKSDLYKVRPDFANIHAWAEVYFPGVGWVEADPYLGASAFDIPACQIQNNRWFQNYAVQVRDGGKEKTPTWTPVKGGFKSDYGVENVISFSKKK